MNSSTERELVATGRRKFAVQVVERLRAAGFEALWAGGCVRDLLLELAPVDYDVATSARPEQVRQLFGPRRTLAVGAAFGVIIVLGPDAMSGQVEVATFRNDATYSDGRRPDAVTFSTAAEDAARRDFTINGMFFDPLTETLIDYVGGREDLARGLIRAIGDSDARIGEDKLRMLRAVRFAARFGFAIEAATEAALSRHAAELSIVSGERMSAEMHKTLTTSGREFALRSWANTGLLNVLLPYLAQHWSIVGEHSCRLLRAIEVDTWIAPLSAILFPLVDSDLDAIRCVRRICSDFKGRLKLSNEDLTHFRFALESQKVLESADQIAWSRLQPLLIHPAIRVGVALLSARVACGEVDAKPLDCIGQCLLQSRENLDPPPLIAGGDLHVLGLQPGPQFKELLMRARNAQLDGLIDSRDQALQWLYKQVRS